MVCEPVAEVSSGRGHPRRRRPLDEPDLHLSDFAKSKFYKELYRIARLANAASLKTDPTPTDADSTPHRLDLKMEDAFVSAIKKLLQARACVQTTSLSTADEILARSWFKRGILLERIEQVILLGCVRKYTSWRNNQNHGPIRSLRYFESVLAELDQQNIKPDYWDYLRSRLGRIEKLWVESHPKTEGAA